MIAFAKFRWQRHSFRREPLISAKPYRVIAGWQDRREIQHCNGCQNAAAEDTLKISTMHSSFTRERIMEAGLKRARSRRLHNTAVDDLLDLMNDFIPREISARHEPPREPQQDPEDAERHHRRVERSDFSCRL